MRHLEEGEIHAWLDVAVGVEESARIEAHLASCAGCSAAVAEARGLIAGASRILLALDNVPGGVVPAGVAGAAGSFKPYQGDMNATPRHRTPWFTRRPLQIAAGLMLAAGLGSVVARDLGRTPQTVKVDFETAPVASLPLELDTAAPPRGVDAATGSGATDHQAPVSVRPREEVAAVAGTNLAEATPPSVAAGKMAAPPVRPPSVRAAATVAAATPPPAPGAIPPTAGDARESFVAGGRARREASQAGGMVGLAAGDTARTQLAIERAVLQLSEVIADAGSPFGALAASCFALDAESDAESRGVPVLPRRIRFRLASSEEPGRGAAIDRAAMGGASGARRLPQAAASADITSEPLTPLPWTRLGPDSIVVTWQRTTDVVTFRLALRGDDVGGRATTNEALVRSATVSGRRVECGGGR